MCRRLWHISLGKRQLIKLLLNIIVLPRGLLLPLTTVFVPMVTTTVHARVRRLFIRLFTFIITIGKVSFVIATCALWLLLLIVAIVLAFTFTTITLHVANLHQYNLVLPMGTITTTIAITSTLIIILRTKTSMTILSFIYCKCFGLRFVNSMGIT
jgi:hypothetical protein